MAEPGMPGGACSQGGCAAPRRLRAAADAAAAPRVTRSPCSSSCCTSAAWRSCSRRCTSGLSTLADAGRCLRRPLTVEAPCTVIKRRSSCWLLDLTVALAGRARLRCRDDSLLRVVPPCARSQEGRYGCAAARWAGDHASPPRVSSTIASLVSSAATAPTTAAPLACGVLASACPMATAGGTDVTNGARCAVAAVGVDTSLRLDRFCSTVTVGLLALLLLLLATLPRRLSVGSHW